MIIKLRSLKYPKIGFKNNEDGFALIEILVVIAILSILVTLAVPVLVGAQREATIGTLKSDVRNSVDMVIDGKQPLKFVTETDFMNLRVQTQGNQVSMVADYADNKEPVVCVYGTHRFSETDIVAFHYSSKTMKMDDGDCKGNRSPEELNVAFPAHPETTPSTTPPASPAKPEPNQPAATTPVAETPTQPTQNPGSPIDNTSLNPTTKDGVTFTPAYHEQNVVLNFCYDILVTSTLPSETKDYTYTIDLNKGPFWGTNPSTFNDTYGYTTVSLIDNQWKVKGTLGVSSSVPRKFGFCSKQTNEPPINPDWYKVTYTPGSGNSNWWAKMNLTVTTESPYPIRWEDTVDLSTYFKSVAGKTPDFINLNGTKVSGTTYKISGTPALAKYVSKAQPRKQDINIVYYPQGSPW